MQKTKCENEAVCHEEEENWKPAKEWREGGSKWARLTLQIAGHLADRMRRIKQTSSQRVQMYMTVTNRRHHYTVGSIFSFCDTL